MSAKTVPNARPKLTRVEALGYVQKYKTDLGAQKCFLLGIRGYYKHTMGNPAYNDRNIYDDAICLVTPNSVFTYNANVDPSVQKKWVAVLQPGCYLYKIGIHGWNKPPNRRYKALVQAGPVLVHRDGAGFDRGWFGINIHKGSFTTTSSLGCQTIYPTQWSGFISDVETKMSTYEMLNILYVLIEG